MPQTIGTIFIYFYAIITLMINHPCIENLPISKREREARYPELEKFKTVGGNRKYRIKDMGEYFSFEYTNENSRYFVHAIFFSNINEAKKFIFSSDCP